MSFADLGLIPELLRAVEDAGYTTPTPIQAQAIPVVLAGQDVMGGAQTGTGKTASFTLPLLQRMAPHASTSTSPARHPVRALILAPTRELAMQVQESVQTYSKHLPLRSTCIYGGVDMNAQIAELRRGIEVVVATPGRLLDHVQQKTINLSQVEFLVLDEADRMLDMGFIPDIRRILALLPAKRQSLLFSATFSEEIKKLADSMLRNPLLIEVARRNTVSETISHVVHPVSSHVKRDLLADLLNAGADGLDQTLVFVATKFGCSRLARHLVKEGISADAIHGDKTQLERTEALEKFRTGAVRVLVATDVAARGLDIDDLPYVVNFELPSTPEDYIHRIGRTGRAGKQGTAVSLVAPEEQQKLAAIEKLIKFKIPQQQIPGYGTDTTQEELRRQRRSHSHARPAPQVAADGFDFNRPYNAAASGKSATTIATPPERKERQARALAVLLGGTGRGRA
ncbi:MAG: DEAD/DEAH box helicase [Candidatus Dactylopiibacterium carminicum]|uniref:DEAD-box ATP-dependent RNA helicase RhpA n=1 Tax=Candidatus Dactylopiibacterium carminicum TaxID=857335 RepID=A0A272ESS7_9RHOO|nr:DEAD/DEAH box helicase [Candidatus Dactylopiibacterium carminicum]KAF7600758.1 DEAD/DEAH box helicase [Candidatus Dactylopiibacterium carminicum]PAS93173.1 MAG: DEAD/DEAH box helicase [Candidatus Dactylopiibacterium carminicum]PAS95868.1 MAG: DEAD/DEAH box helicase [Candidatus Dactylopiibacterium carminicum]PAT00765.1 MAG: DEAD/DEAH box helicase [Candidatus Dactylopiibacterium carminicum]